MTERVDTSCSVFLVAPGTSPTCLLTTDTGTITESECHCDGNDGLVRARGNRQLYESAGREVPRDVGSWLHFVDNFFRLCQQLDALVLFHNYREVRLLGACGCLLRRQRPWGACNAIASAMQVMDEHEDEWKGKLVHAAVDLSQAGSGTSRPDPECLCWALLILCDMVRAPVC